MIVEAAVIPAAQFAPLQKILAENAPSYGLLGAPIGSSPPELDLA